jgi:uncharacterized protein
MLAADTAQEHDMPGRLRHFAINADDVDRVRRFYETVPGWSFEPWGPPDLGNVLGAKQYNAGRWS